MIINKLMKRWADSTGSNNNSDINSITIGYVIDTNDPQQMGRVRALCPALGDSTSPEDYQADEIPWAQYSSPFGGVVDESKPRGPLNSTDDNSRPLGYGMWNPPRVGAQVLIMCIDGDPQYRVYMGCLYVPHTTHVLPHGRYSYNIPLQGSTTLDGPFSSSETPIQPLYDNITKSFTSSNPIGANGRESIEWLSRAADFSATALDNQNILTSFSKIPDDKNQEVELPDGTTFTKRQGYTYDRINRQQENIYTGARYDNSVHSWSTPGFHAISMDDRPENCRMRFRTTTGHQIILDDSNERIYISTAEGKNWIEMDQKGNVDIYAEQKISIHSDSDINLDASGNIRLSAQNIHLNSKNETRIFSESDLHLKTQSNMRVYTDQSLFIETGTLMNVLVGTDFLTTAGSSLQFKSSSSSTFDCSNFNCKAGNINLDGTTNGAFVGDIVGTAEYATTAGEAGKAGTAGSLGAAGVAIPVSNPKPIVSPLAAASASESIHANLATRKPLHEPWPRISYNLNLTDVNDPTSIPSQVLEHDPNSIKVNIEDHGIKFDRNPYWLR